MPTADLRMGDAQRLPWPDESFDGVAVYAVLVSVGKRYETPDRPGDAASTKPDGAILWYDFRYNNPSNRNVRGIEAADPVVVSGCTVRLRRVTLAPLIARRVVPVSWIGALLLEKIQFLRRTILASSGSGVAGNNRG